MSLFIHLYEILIMYKHRFPYGRTKIISQIAVVFQKEKYVGRNSNWSKLRSAPE
jgi:hypothetical protein